VFLKTIALRRSEAEREKHEAEVKSAEEDGKGQTFLFSSLLGEIIQFD